MTCTDHGNVAVEYLNGTFVRAAVCVADLGDAVG